MRVYSKKVSRVAVGKTFDEAALQRLLELAGRAKSEGTKLQPADRLELRELKARQQAAKAAATLAKIEVGRRKSDDRTKYELGTLMAMAGLANWAPDTLLGGLLDLATADELRKAEYTKLGIHFWKQKQRVAVRVRIRFLDDPGEAVKTYLHDRGFTWNAEVSAWDGLGDPEEFESEAELAAAVVERI